MFIFPLTQNKYSCILYKRTSVYTMRREELTMMISGKIYRVKSRSRFSLFIAFVIVVIVMISNTFLGLNDASSLTQQSYIEITVQHGDTLWNIANKYMPENKDIRRAVYTLCRINEISAHELKAGQILLIPVNKNSLQ